MRKESSNYQKQESETDKVGYCEELNTELGTPFPTRASPTPPLLLYAHGAAKHRQNMQGQRLAEFGLRTNNLSSCWLSLLLSTHRECKPFTLETIPSCSC